MTSGRPDARSARIQESLVAGQDAADAGQWVAAGLAWIEAAKLGSLDGANAVEPGRGLAHQVPGGWR